jgi:hypothetical protein
MCGIKLRRLSASETYGSGVAQLVVIRLRAGRSGFDSRHYTKDFSLLQHVQTFSGFPPSLLFIRWREVVGDKAARA